MKIFKKQKLTVFVVLMAVIIAMPFFTINLSNKNANAASGIMMYGASNEYFNDFEDATITDDVQWDNKTLNGIGNNVGGRLFWYAENNANISLVDEGENRALKVMFNTAVGVSDDQKSIGLFIPDLLGWESYRLSFDLKRVNENGTVNMIRSGMPSFNYSERREFGTAFNSVFANWTSISQIIPASPWNDVTASIMVNVPANWNTDTGLYIDNIRVQYYEPIPAGKTNVIKNSSVTGQWIEPNWIVPDWNMNVGSGVDDFWAANRYSGASNIHMGTNNDIPVTVSQAVSLSANTKYDVSMQVKKFWMDIPEAASDTFTVGIKDNGTYENKFTINPLQIGQKAFEDYLKLGCTLETGEATEYTFFIEHMVTEQMSWRGCQVDDVYMYESDINTYLNYTTDVKSKTANVTEQSDFYSTVTDAKVLQANVNNAEAIVEYEITGIAPLSTCYAGVDIQKLNDMNMNISFTVEDTLGNVLAGLSDTNTVEKAAEPFRIKFSNGSTTTAIMKVHVAQTAGLAAPVEDSLINFKNFFFNHAPRELVNIEAGTDRNISINDTNTVVVNAIYDDDFIEDVSSSSVISSDTPAIVSVLGTVLTAEDFGTSIITVEFGGKTVTFEANVPVEVTTLDAGIDRIINKGLTETMIVLADYNNGDVDVDVSGSPDLIITSSNENVSVDGNILTAVSVGTSTITVTLEEISASFVITVPRELLSINAGNDRTIPLSETANISVIASYNDDTTEDVSITALITSENANVTILGNIMTAEILGTSLISVSFEDKTTSFIVTVANKLESITANTDINISKGQTSNVVVIATYIDEATENITSSAVITSSDITVVTYSDGVLTAIKVGQSTINISFGGQSTSFVVTVPKELSSISVGEDRSISKGQTATVIVTANYNDDTNEDATSSATISSDSENVTVSGNVLTAVSVGTATITVSFGSKSTSFIVTVPKELLSISAGSDRQISKGQAATVTVTAFYNDGEEKIVSAVLSSSNANVIVLGASLTASEVGTATITAAFGGKQATFIVTIPKELLSISAGNDRNIIKGQNSEITVIALYNDNTSEIITENVTITSENGNVTVSGSTLTAVTKGTSIITVAYNDKSATFTVTVPKTLLNISATADKESVNVKGTVEITVTATYDDDSTETITTFTLTSSDLEVASIEGTTITANKAGSVTITATYMEKTDTITITINAVKSGCNKSNIGTVMATLFAFAVLAFVKFKK